MVTRNRTKQGNKRQSESLPENDPLNLDKSNEYLHRTYEIYGYILSFISHDLLSTLATVRGHLHLLTLSLQRLTSERVSKDALTTTDLQEFADSAERLVAAGIRMHTFIDKHVRGFRDHAYGNPFRSRPSKILEIVLKDVQVTVSTEGDQDLEFTFPANVLAAIFSELISNVAEHSGKERADALIIWRHNNAFFECEIHDNGPGVVGGTTSMVPYDFIRKQAHGKGLDLIDRVITTARGIVLFGKSEKLGGTKVFLKIPVADYHVDER